MGPRHEPKATRLDGRGNWPLAMHYTGLDKRADYVVRTTGYGTCLLAIDGERVRPTIDGKGIGEFKEFPVPKHLLGEEFCI